MANDNNIQPVADISEHITNIYQGSPDKPGGLSI